MSKFKNILVALDLSEIDDTLIPYASFIADKLQVEKVYFVHNIKKYEISDLFSEELKDVNLDELIGDELNDKIGEKFTGKSDWEVLISEDSYSESLIQYIVNKYRIQLTILGNKNRRKGTGEVSGKLLRMLKCDILTVPIHFPPKLKKIWAGTDFSQASRKVFGIARELQDAFQADITAVHVYHVPVHFSPYVSKEDMVPKVEKHVEESGKRFMKRLNYPNKIEVLIIPGREAGIAEKLREQAEKNKIDLLLVSDKGNNMFSSLLIGSTPEEIFNQDLSLPLWIAKTTQ